MTDDTLELSVRSVNEWTVVRAMGELTLVTADQMTRFVWDSAAVAGHPRVVIDVGGLWMCDSSGLNAFVRTWKLLDSAGGTLVLASPGPRLAKTLSITGLDRRLQISPDIIHALRAEQLSSAERRTEKTPAPLSAEGRLRRFFHRIGRRGRFFHRVGQRAGAWRSHFGRSVLSLALRWTIPRLAQSLMSSLSHS